MRLDLPRQTRPPEGPRGSIPAGPDAGLHDWTLAELEQRLFREAPWRVTGLIVPWRPASLHWTILDQPDDGEDAQRERLERALRDAFDADPLEDGVSHPVEQIVATAVGTSGALDWLRGFVLETDSPIFGASTLRCLGRLNGVGTAAWRTDLVQRALTNEDVQVRDAALQAAEAWDDADLGRVLAAHLPSEPVGWLRDAMQDVVESMRG